MNTFPAFYPGTCGQCGSEFEEGDPIGYIDDELCCEDCVEESDDFTGSVWDE